MRSLLLVLLLCATAMAQFKTSCDDTIEITSLPYTMGYSDTCYCISGTVTSATNGISTGKHDRVLLTAKDGGTGNISFALGGSDLRYGLSISGSQYLLVRGINIIAGGALLDDNPNGDSGNVCILDDGGGGGYWTQYIWIDSCGIYADGLDGRGFSQVVDEDRASFNFTFTHNTFYTWSTQFSRRILYTGALIRMEASAETNLPGDYFARIDSNLFERSIHVAVAITGSSVVPDSGALFYIRGNEFHQQARNDRYTTYTDNNDYSVGDPMAITIIGAMRNSEISDNDIFADDVNLHYGGSGMLLQGMHGWPDLPVRVYNNRMTLRNGRHIALSALKQAAQGIYVRSLDKVTPNQNLWIYNNDIQIYVDTIESTTSTGRTAEGIRMLMDKLSHNIVISNNHISINRSDSALGFGNGSGEQEIIVSAMTIAQEPDVPSGELRIFDNYFGAYKAPIRYGSNRESSFGANNTLLIRDTIVSYVNDDTTFWFETNGSYVGHSINNIHQDCIFDGYAQTSDIVFAGGSAVDSLGKSVEYWQTVKLLVLGSDGKPVPFAYVNFANAHHEDFAGYTNYLGWWQKTFKIKYDHQDYILTDGYNPGDSTFNPFTFTVYSPMGDESQATTMTITPLLYTDTIRFTGIVGTDPPTGSLMFFLKEKISPIIDEEEDGPPEP